VKRAVKSAVEQVTSCEQDCCAAEKYSANSLKNKQVLKQLYSTVKLKNLNIKTSDLQHVLTQIGNPAFQPCLVPAA